MASAGQGPLPPTRKRRQRARRASHHPRYQALARVIPLGAGCLAAAMAAPGFLQRLKLLLELALTQPTQARLGAEQWQTQLAALCLSGLGVLSAAALGALFAGACAQGLRMRLRLPKWRGPWGGSQAGTRAIQDLLRGLFAALAIGWLILEASAKALPQLLATESARAAINCLPGLLAWSGSRIFGVGLAWLLADSLWAYRRWLLSLRMTQHQVEQELRESGRRTEVAQTRDQNYRPGTSSPATG